MRVAVVAVLEWSKNQGEWDKKLAMFSNNSNREIARKFEFLKFIISFLRLGNLCSLFLCIPRFLRNHLDSQCQDCQVNFPAHTSSFQASKRGVSLLLIGSSIDVYMNVSVIYHLNLACVDSTSGPNSVVQNYSVLQIILRLKTECSFNSEQH